MTTHECIQEENIGKFKEFVNNTKGMRTAISTIVIAIVIQVGTFLYLWGSLTTTVKNNTSYVWGDLRIQTTENTRNIDKILSKFEIVGVAKNVHAEGGK